MRGSLLDDDIDYGTTISQKIGKHGNIFADINKKGDITSGGQYRFKGGNIYGSGSTSGDWNVGGGYRINPNLGITASGGETSGQPRLNIGGKYKDLNVSYNPIDQDITAGYKGWQTNINPKDKRFTFSKSWNL